MNSEYLLQLTQPAAGRKMTMRSDLQKIDAAEFRSALPEFEEKTREFYDGKMSLKDYKSFSGKYGSYAQRGGKANMLRLRMTAGRLTPEKLNFLVDMVDRHHIDKVHFTTCQAVQLHNLQPEAVFDIMDKALDVDIVCYGGGGDYPRNVMCSPLTGTEKDEYFDVLPYAQKTAEYLLHFIDREKMPRKLKVAFSSSKANEPHATFRDLGFAAREDGTFDVYAAGGLGNNPRLGVCVAEKVSPDMVLYYAKAMINTFKKHGNYKNRAKARTRYMVEALGGEEAFVKAFNEELQAVFDSGEDLRLKDVEVKEIEKTPDGICAQNWRVLEQKQPGLYTVMWHPVGGSPNLEVLHRVRDALKEMKDTEIRLTPDETACIINLTGKEAEKILEITAEDAAKNPFEASISCIGSTICQVGLRDSQGLLADCVRAAREAGLKDSSLPRIHISGCPSSCGTHQIGKLGFRGAIKMVDKKPQPAFILYEYGDDREGSERFGTEIGTILQKDIPELLVALGKKVEEAGLDYDAFVKENPNAVKETAAAWL